MHAGASVFLQSGLLCFRQVPVCPFFSTQVKLAEHILTGQKVAIKILNRKKIKAMDMDEKVRREIKILRSVNDSHRVVCGPMMVVHHVPPRLAQLIHGRTYVAGCSCIRILFGCMR